MHPARRIGVAAALLAGAVWFQPAPAKAAEEEELALGVRTTEPVPAAEQQSKFRLPPGFEIQLVASEPEIHKPFNLAFDTAGRLWVTTSIEYPWAAPTNRPGRDRLMIFEDFGPDGRARKVTQFADGLNIPIGVYPFRSPRRAADGTVSGETWKAIVWSIPHLWLLEDTDGDGRADERTILYGPFDHTRDTHGNQASFRRGFDGWLYCTHGFNNDSHVTARDGSHVDLNSGNTYRIRLDGSRIEHHTHGQVNPYGLTWDARGNLYSSDCHSAPIYQLLAGGWYPSFGKPHDGLGFAPVMLEHAHGSTAIDGALYYNDSLWPEEYQDTFFVGNVMTSRLNRDKITFTGSTPKATEQPDFLTSTDPWFRPVDTTLGPDGALYIADFYNRIIGHYEVALTHPGRDRERGRLWRVIHRGTNGVPALRDPRLPEDLDGLVGELGSPSLNRRLLAMAAIEDRFGAPALPRLRAAASRAASGTAEGDAVQVGVLWMLHRLGALDNAAEPAELLAGLRAPGDSVVRVHALRVVAERGRLARQNAALAARMAIGPAVTAAVRSALVSDRGLASRCAAEALGEWPSPDNLRPLLDTLAVADPADTHRVYVLRKALRDHLKDPVIFRGILARADGSESDRAAFADVAIAVPSAEAARFLLGRLDRLNDTSAPPVGEALRHAARHMPESELAPLAGVIRSRYATQPDFQLALYRAVDEGLQQRSLPPPPALREWGAELAVRLLPSGPDSGWRNVPLEAATENPWDFQDRKRSDGRTVRTLSSLMQGESRTGTLRSPEFTAGRELRFWLCGHDGPPDRPARNANGVRLRDATTGAVLFEVRPPRNDVAQPVVWDTASLGGRRVVLEATDGDTGDAFAWLAFGDLEGGPEWPAISPRLMAERTAGATDLASRLSLRDLAPRLRSLAAQPGDPELRATAARGLATLDPAGATEVLAPLLADERQPLLLRERLGVTLAEINTPDSRAAVAAAFAGVPYRVQQAWAVALMAKPEGAETFLQAVEKGAASPRILQFTGARNRLQRANPDRWQERVERLTRDLVPADEAREKLMASRRNAYALADASAAKGRQLFEVNCLACHQVEGKGGLVGPQLTGIGNRGVERLCEDILDPNRNVDHAFRQTLVVLKDGEARSGLFRREEGGQLVFVDAAGQEFAVSADAVAERRELDQSLMPENFGEIIPESEFPHLLAFLLSERGGQ